LEKVSNLYEEVDISYCYDIGHNLLFLYYIRGGSVCQLRNLITSGEYPQMNVSYTSYPSEKFQMAIKFSELSSFSAIVSECELEKGNWAGYYPYNIVVLPKQMNFKQDNTKLDKNGDGILDSTQGI